MRTRFRTLSSRWATGRLEVMSVKRASRHTVLRVQITGNDNTRPLAVFEIKDLDIYRLADNIVDHVEAFELGKKAQQ